MPSTSPRAATQGPSTQRKRPGDLTGTRGQKLVQERDEAQAEEAEALAAQRAQERVTKLSTVVDYTGSPNAHRVEEIAVAAEPHPKEMTIRVNYPIEDMTWGREVISDAVFDENGLMQQAPVLGGLKTYNFEEGVQYRVPFELGAHLKSLGYVYDF